MTEKNFKKVFVNRKKFLSLHSQIWNDWQKRFRRKRKE